MDENVVEPRLDLGPGEARALRLDRPLQRLAVEARDAQRPAEHRRRFDARRMAQRDRGAVDVVPGPLEGDEAGLRDDRGRAALHDDAPLREIDDALAALGLVHVVGRDERRQPLDRHVVDEVPELAPRLGVDARGRLVEQQEFRLMQDAGGEREPLLPAAGQLPGQLVAAVLEAHALHDRADRLASIANLVDAGDEVEVLEDRQVLIEAEALRHVADLAADLDAVADDVVAEAWPVPASGLSRPQSMRIVVVLPLPFAPRKPQISPSADLQVQAFDDLQVAETLAQSVDVDDVSAHGALV